MSSPKCSTSLLLLSLATAALCSVTTHAEEPVDVQLGHVYIVDHHRLAASAAELIGDASLDGVSAWINSTSIDASHSQTLTTERQGEFRAICVDRRGRCVSGRWFTYESTVELLGANGTVREIRGVHELPDILNRPLTGALSVRSEEIAVAKMRHQVARAISDCGANQYVAVCVGSTTLLDPQLRIKGYADIEQVTAVATLHSERLGVTLAGVDGPDDEGAYLAHMKGEVLCEGTFRTMKDSEPRFGKERLFFLADVRRATLSVDANTARFTLGKD